MGRETEVRGEQAGGGLVFARDRDNQIITEELNTFMGTAIAQIYHIGATFCRRIFTTNSGRRTAAPQQTLTELLLYLTKRIRQKYSYLTPLNTIVTPENILELESIKERFLDRSIVSIVGTDACGEAIAQVIKPI